MHPASDPGRTPDPNDPIIPTHVPALLVQLLLAERAKGSPLTEAEVLSVRDNGAAITLRASDIRKMAEKRGYDDIDPHRAWEQWQIVRTQIEIAGDDAPAP